RLVRPGGCYRHVDYRISVGRASPETKAHREPLTLALVLDRSGSMNGGKLETAKSAALAVLDRLEEQDRVAVVVFDDKIDLLQGLAPVTPAIRAQMKAGLGKVQARGMTALHEGWLLGCQAIAGEDASPSGRGLSRCFVLTDGLANVGLTDAEQIASQAADIRRKTGIGTSTFGIGPDYDEGLLAPMAVAGEGQFHHLRDGRDITSTFIGELGEILNVAARNVAIELEVGPDTEVDVVSAYRSQPSPERRSYTIGVGDLLAGEERHVVVRFHFPAQHGQDGQAIRARLLWNDGNNVYTTDWQETGFSYADNRACDAERRDSAVMKWVGLHHAERAKLEATALNRRGDLNGARKRVHSVVKRIHSYADGDADLLQAVEELEALEPELSNAPISPMASKNISYQAQRTSRGQRDHREP
ncbi:MAG: VWA domain-containing protein, partial [Dehalococcoidia bacterium]|nr:VWA domain-containing protein [Dehalococcoidia bacterium]